MADVLHHENHGHDEHHHHDDTDITVFGFWTYLMSDLDSIRYTLHCIRCFK